MSSVAFLCPACHSPGDPRHAVCAACGLVFSSYTPGAGPVPPAAPAPIVCPACGQSSRAGSIVCTACGTSLVFSYAPLRAGQRLANGRYTVRRALSHGGMGAIYLATDHGLFDRAVVVKALLDYFDPHNPHEVQNARARFLLEAQTLAELRHPAIPQIYSYFQDGPHNYIVMEYVAGENLEHGLTHADDASGITMPGRPYDQEQVPHWGVALCRVLEYLASRQPHPVIHHDIKPANLLLDQQSNQIRLVDFGTARARLLIQPGVVGVQQSSVFGTHGYAAPEQYRAQSEPRSDVYALAATLYHLATDDDPRNHPFAFPRLASLSAFGQALQAALNHDPAQRPTAAELRQRLEDALAPTSVAGLPAPDGTLLNDAVDLARWCEANWPHVYQWLHYGGLPDQVERLWGKTKLAQDMRQLLSLGAVNDRLVDRLIAMLDPTGFGQIAPQVRIDPPAVDFGRVTSRAGADSQVTLLNTGRRWADLSLKLPEWASAAHTRLQLGPGEHKTVTLRAQPTVAWRWGPRGRLRLFATGEEQSYLARSRTLPQARLRVSGSFWALLSWKLRLLVLSALLVVALVLGFQGYEAWHYHVATAAFERGAWGQARDELALVLAQDNQYRDAPALLQESFYRGGLEAIGNRQWGAALAQLTRLEGMHPGYRDTRALIVETYYQRLREAVARRDWNGAIPLIRELELRDSDYRDVADLIASQPELASMVDQGRAEHWKLAILQPRRPIDLNVQANTVAFSPDGKLLVLGGLSDRIEIHNAGDGALIRQIDTRHGVLRRLAVSPDGQMIATGGNDATVKLWSVADGSQLRVLDVTATPKAVVGLAFRNDSRYLAALDDAGRLTMWDVRGGQLIWQLETRQQDLSSLVFTPDGTAIAASGPRGMINLWRPSDGRLMQQFKAFDGPAANLPFTDTYLSFSSDGTLLAFGSRKTYVGVPTVKLWRVSDGALLQSIDSGDVTSVALSPDGQLLAASNWTGQVNIWRVADGQVLQVLQSDAKPTWSVVFSPAADELAISSGHNNSVRIWRALP